MTRPRDSCWAPCTWRTACSNPRLRSGNATRRSARAFPTLHRNLGLALLHAGMHDREARAVLEEGLVADSTNVDVYLTLDGVLSAANASPRDRAAALRRFPAPERMPSSMVFKLALALAEAGDAGPAEALFHHRFFPQEEGGTSVRTVYAQVRLISARTAAAEGDCGAARDILDALHARTEGPHVHRGRTCRHAAAADDGPPGCSRSNGRAAARTPRSARWQRLANGLNGDGGPLAVAIADEARERLGYHEPQRTVGGSKRRSRPRRGRWNQAAPATRGRSSTRVRWCWRRWAGSTNRASPSDACSSYPDRNLSHAMARTAMNDASADRGDKK